MALTLRQILQIDVLQDAKIIAAEKALNRPVDSVTTIEVTDNSIQDWVSPNQLCITTLYSIRDNLEKQMNLIRVLHEKGCAGIVVCHIGIWIKKLSPQIIAFCRQIDFPLIIPDSHTIYVDILNPIIFQIMSGQKDYARKYSSLRSDIVDILVKSTDIFSALHEIAAKDGNSVSFFDPYGNCLFSDKSKDYAKLVQQHIKENFNLFFSELVREKYLILNTITPPGLVYLIIAHNSIQGFVVTDLKGDPGNASILENGKMLNTVCALMMGRRNSALSVKDYYTQEYVNDLLVWNFPSKEIALRRGRDLDIHLTNQNTVIAINFNDIQRQSIGQTAELTPKISTENIASVTVLCQQADSDSIIVQRADQILIFMLCQDTGGHQARMVGNKICAMLTQGPPTASVSIGISIFFQDLSNIPDAYMQTKKAIQLGREFFGENRVCTFDDIYFIDTVRMLRKDANAVRIGRELLRPLYEYDKQNKSDLLRTLYYMIRYGYNVEQLSKRLFVHRNTLRNRREKITEILGYPPLEMPHFLNLFIAFEMGQPVDWKDSDA